MSSPDAPVLVCAGIRKAFGHQTVLQGVDLSVPVGSITAVLGPSGGGKTTLLRIIAGFERPDGGTVTVRGQIVESPSTSMPPERRQVGIVPQEGALFPHLSVGRNVGYGLPRGHDRSARVAECLALVGLEGLEHMRPHELSGGQQQRVALARALAPRPSLIMLDEPFSSLDASLRTRVRTEVCGLLRQIGATAVLVTHDQQEALSVADQVAVLLRGHIVQATDPLSLYQAPVNLEVATFVGDAVVVGADRHGDVAICALGRLALRPDPSLPSRIVVVLRPEQIRLGDGPGRVPARVLRTEFHGPDATVELAITGLARSITARVPVSDLPTVGESTSVFVAGRVLAYTPATGSGEAVNT